MNLARLCYDTLLEFGLTAKMGCKKNVVTPAVEKVIEVNTLHSGLGFESGGVASAHSVANGLTMWEATKPCSLLPYHQFQKIPATILDKGRLLNCYD